MNLNILNSQTPGYALLVGKEGKIIYEDYVGLANLKTQEPITKNTAFRLASLTKQFTAMGIMILYKNKLISYEDRIKKFFPDFSEYGENITVRQLLTHTSGIPDHEKPLYKKIKTGYEPTIYDALRILKKGKKLLFKSNTRCKYSDAGFVVLALILEKVTGQKYGKFLADNIFKPLNMQNTYVLDETKPNIKNRAIGYRKFRNKWQQYDYDPLNYIVGDEGVYSTVQDLYKWEGAWFTNALVSNQMLEEALTPQRLTSSRQGKWGFSWFIKDQLLFQPGSWVGFNNIMLTDMKIKTTVIFLSNTTEFPRKKDKLSVAMKILNIVSL